MVLCQQNKFTQTAKNNVLLLINKYIELNDLSFIDVINQYECKFILKNSDICKKIKKIYQIILLNVIKEKKNPFAESYTNNLADMQTLKIIIDYMFT